jgi:hypothetical protein
VQPEHNADQHKPQEKKMFVVRDTPVWLDQHQDWISDGARRLYKTLRTLADQKTGRLFIPGKGWIRIRTIEQKASMSEETRLKYTKELKALGGIEIHRDHVTRSINGRNRKVWGQAQITVLSLKPPKAHKHSRSTTPESKKPNTDKVSTTHGNADNIETEPQSSVSTTPGNEENLPHPDSSGPVESGCQKMSEGTTGPPSPLTFAVENHGSISQGRAPQESPTTTASPAAKGLSYKPEYNYPPQTQSVVGTLKSWLRGFADKYQGVIPVWKMAECREHFLAETNALAIPFRPAVALYESTVQELLTSTIVSEPKPKEAWENPTLDASRQVMDALKSAGSTGCSSNELANKVYNCGLARGRALYRANGRIVQLIARLRKKGWPIITLGEDSRSKRYSLRTD